MSSKPPRMYETAVDENGVLVLPDGLFTGSMVNAQRFDMIPYDGRLEIRACPHVPDSRGRYPLGHTDTPEGTLCGMVRITCRNEACGAFFIVEHEDNYPDGWIQVAELGADLDTRRSDDFCCTPCVAAHYATGAAVTPLPEPPQVFRSGSRTDVALTLPAGEVISLAVNETDGSVEVVDLTELAANLIGRGWGAPNRETSNTTVIGTLTGRGWGAPNRETSNTTVIGTLTYPSEAVVVIAGAVVDLGDAMEALIAGLIDLIRDAANRLEHRSA